MSVFGNVSVVKNDILVNIQLLDREEANEGLSDIDRSDRIRFK